MYIKKIKIKNFKCFKDFSIELKPGVNVLVGDNDSGKSTILEAVNLALAGLFHGRFLRNELSQHLFNNEAVDEYLAGIHAGATPPTIFIEIYLGGEGVDRYKGDGNSDRDSDAAGFRLEIRFDENYKEAYAEMVKQGINSLPIECYESAIESFARLPLVARTIPLAAAYIDSSSAKYLNGSDIYISRIIKDFLEEEELAILTKAHREMAESFSTNTEVAAVNKRIEESGDLPLGQKISLAVDLAGRNSWESTLLTCVDKVPYQYIGKGAQSLVKMAIALAHKKAERANVLLVEEPENHLSHSNLNQMIKRMLDVNNSKQVIISTHSSFVANKSSLQNLIMLHDGKTVRLNELDPSTENFFRKLAGYDTLRLLLCQKAILVEGDSDELVVQAAYRRRHGRLPIEDGVDVISVGLSFVRFLEIASVLNKPVVVVTDNDGDLDALMSKYVNYLDANAKPHISICYDSYVDGRDSIRGKKFNFNTLEPRLLAANSRDTLNRVFGTSHGSDEDLLKYMKGNKTECALMLFDTQEALIFPDYIERAVSV